MQIGVDTVSYLRIALGLLFVAVGISKCFNRRAFERAVAGFQVVPERLAPVAAALIVGLEIAGGGMLVLGAQVRLGAFIIAGLLACFSFALVLNLMRGRRNLECECYGGRSLRIGWGHVAQNAALLGIALLIGFTAVFGSPNWLTFLAAAYTATLFLAAQALADVRAGLIRILSRIKTE